VTYANLAFKPTQKLVPYFDRFRAWRHGKLIAVSDGNISVDRNIPCSVVEFRSKFGSDYDKRRRTSSYIRFIMIASLRRSSHPLPLIGKVVLLGSAFYVLVFLFDVGFQTGKRAVLQKLPQPLSNRATDIRGNFVLFLCSESSLGSQGAPLGARIIGLGCLSWSAGQATWAYIESIQGLEIPFPGWPDAGYLSSYPFWWWECFYCLV
jgi:hypothetical protein